ncbi:MAG: hypothetical protein MRZ79_07240, partial [Bacteroidia bacterium]|nr:hypothetical protein [Bacteroidia bacterium]
MSLFQYDQRWEGNLYLPIYFILIGAMIMVAGRFSFAQSSLISTPLSQNFLPAEYQGGSQNWAIAQDKRGFLYVANHYGLLEFDGNKWSLYRTNLGGSLKSVRVDSDGDIYVGGQGKFGYFSPDTKGKLQYQALDVLLPEEYRDFDEVWDIYDTSEGMYFFTRRHIFLYQHKQFQVFSLPKMQYAYYYNYKLFVSSWEKGLMVKGDEGFEEIKGGEIFKRKSIRAIVAGANNQALIATLDG